MKKTLITIAIAAMTASTFAQGTLNILNNLTGNFRAQIYGPDVNNAALSLSGNSAAGIPAGSTVYTGALLQGTGYTFAVYYGASTVASADGLSLLTSTTFRTGGAAGLINTLSNFQLPGIAAGDTAKLEVRVWDNANGTINSFDNAITRGRSGMFNSQALGGGVLLSPDMTGWQSFNIYTVPEPSTFVLAGLGAASLLIFRRRK